MAAVTKLYRFTVSSFIKLPKISTERFFSNASIIAKRNDLFDAEKKRQRDNIGRIEKIEVRYVGLPEDATLVMNRDLSTPYNCAQHLSEGHCKQSALALVNGTIPWDMHRPLTDNCSVELLNFFVAEPHSVNKAFWRTCSFMLGAALQTSFKKSAGLQLHSFPTPNVRSGSFVYDIVLDAKSWAPTKSELRAISAEMVRLANRDIKIERLEVQGDLAYDMFKDSHYKNQQLPNIIEQNQGKVTLYRMGEHIDISRGPMVGSTRFLGKCSVTAIHKIADENADSSYFRVQGVALPNGFILNHVAYNTLENRARKLNTARLPTEPYEEPQMQLA